MIGQRAATTTTTTTLLCKSRNNTIMKLCTTVIIALIASHLILSAHAIRCHQCNSHEQEDCNELRLNTPRAQLDTQYLKECVGEHANVSFCRKTVTRIEVTGEHRVVRSCGWIRGSEHDSNMPCMNVDNEGYKHLMCSCFEDGCNAAPTQAAQQSLLYAAVGLSAVVVVLLRQHL